jgi:hypothetical protein
MTSARSKLKLGLAALVIVTLAGALRAGGVSAQENRAQQITVSPPAKQLSVDPGGSVKETFEVINSGDKAYALEVSSSAYFVEGTAYEPTFKPLPGKTNASQWVSITGFGAKTLNGKETRKINYSVNVPANTAAGGYYAVIFAEAKPLKTENGGVVTTNRVGHILYITVKGQIETKGTLTALELPGVVLDDAVKPGVLVGNTGGVHFTSKVTQTAKNVLGKAVYSAELERIVLPETQREITSEWDQTPPFGIYKIEQSATVAGKDQSVAAKWVLIIKPWVILVIVAALALLIAWQYRKRHGHKKSKKTDKD